MIRITTFQLLLIRVNSFFISSSGIMGVALCGISIVGASTTSVVVTVNMLVDIDGFSHLVHFYLHQLNFLPPS